MAEPTPLDETTEELIVDLEFQSASDIGPEDSGEALLAAEEALRSRIRELVEEARKEGEWIVIPGEGETPDGIALRGTPDDRL